MYSLENQIIFLMSNFEGDFESLSGAKDSISSVRESFSLA